MGKAVSTADVPVVKATSGIVVLSKEESVRRAVEPCIRCGKCNSVCALKLEPYLLMALCQKDMMERAETERITDCCECGSCSFICPASRPLLDYIRLGKSQVLRMKRERTPEKIKSKMSNILNISPAPHIFGKDTTRSLMLDVIIALSLPWLHQSTSLAMAQLLSLLPQLFHACF